MAAAQPKVIGRRDHPPSAGGLTPASSTVAMKVSLWTRPGEVIEVPCDGSDTIDKIKAKIFTEYGIHPQKQQLMVYETGEVLDAALLPTSSGQAVSTSKAGAKRPRTEKAKSTGKAGAKRPRSESPGVREPPVPSISESCASSSGLPRGPWMPMGPSGSRDGSRKQEEE